MDKKWDSYWTIWHEHGPDKEPALCEFLHPDGAECCKRATWFKPGKEIQFCCNEHKEVLEKEGY